MAANVISQSVIVVQLKKKRKTIFGVLNFNNYTMIGIIVSLHTKSIVFFHLPLEQQSTMNCFRIHGWILLIEIINANWWFDFDLNWFLSQHVDVHQDHSRGAVQ